MLPHQVIAQNKVSQIARSMVFLLFDDRLIMRARSVVRRFITYIMGEILGHTYAAAVAASASRVGGGFANPPDTASMQRLRASLSEDT